MKLELIGGLPPNVTYRQFDYWCSKGWIDGGKDLGSGYRRGLVNKERLVLMHMGRSRVGGNMLVRQDA